MFIRLDRDYEVKCTLGTIKEIESKYNKSFYTVIGALDKMTVTEQLRLLYIGVKRADAGVREQQFFAVCDAYLGVGALTDYLEQFVFALQYPGLSREEVQQKIEKKLAANRARQKDLPGNA